MAQGDRRIGDRIAVGFRARLAYATVEELVERFAVDVSRGGFFLRTRAPKPPGTEIVFELLLAGGERAIHGRGVVRWVSAPSPDGPSTPAPGPARPAPSARGARTVPGMGIQFTALDAPSRALVERMVALQEKRGGLASLNGDLEFETPGRSPVSLASPKTADALPTLSLPGRGDETRRASSGQGPGQRPEPVVLTPSQAETHAGDPSASKPPVQADLSASHVVQRLSAGPIALDLGLPHEPPPVTRPSRAIIGIDLGTTNSCAAIVKDGKPYVIPSREGYNTVPSIVALNARQRVVVGHLARAQLLSNPKDTVYGAKRLIGRTFESRPVQQIREAFAYDVVEGDGGMAAVELAGHRLSLEQVSALVLKEVKEVAQNHLGEEVNRAVITVPAYYNERQRAAVRRAGALAGFHVERIVNEPTAAALAYAYGRGVRQRILVYDLGGGTFDASVLELQDNVYEVVSTGGDTFLGGVDFDNRIVARLLELYEHAVKRPFDGDRVALSRLVDAAERAKCALSERQEFRIQLPFLAMKDGEPVTLDATLTRDEIVKLVEPLVQRTLVVCREVLDAKGLAPEDLDEVILVGGQSRMPLVHERVRAFFGKAPSRAVHPDEAVAIGAALLARSLGNAEGLVLIDVLPMAIGIAAANGKVRPIFERNTPLPSRKQVGLATTEDGQTEFELVVVQGEAPLAEDCEYLGTLRLDGLPAGPRGMVKIAVGFELGVECLLTVTARELQTNRVVKTSFVARAPPSGKGATGTSEARPAVLPTRPRPTVSRGGVLGFFGRLLGREAR
ncbi:MAG: 2-alkenal reductase [Anaeromyxobacter sp. RBG_16_69_14]|nr:MAG: 2-alkenal reductase [Anaeromyxobacter sp. RBG_16_69_14]